MRKILVLLGSVLVVAACDRTPTAPLQHSPNVASEECGWVKSGDLEPDSTYICV